MTRKRERPRRIMGSAVPHGPSIIDHIETHLLDHCRRYLEMKRIPFGDDPSVSLATERGIIRGLAISVARIRYAYEDVKVCTKRVEKEFIARARAES